MELLPLDLLAAQVEAITAQITPTETALESNTPTFEQLAQPLIAKNVPVIPLRPKTKIAFLTGWESLATTDREQIAQWGQDYSNANIASVAKATLEGVWFFEVDRPNFQNEIEKQTGHKMPETFMVRSSPGRGHFYFRQTPASLAMGNRQDKDAHGEIWSARVDDRYVAGPGSIHPRTGLKYEVLRDTEILPAPDWLVEWCVNNSNSDVKETGHAELDSEEPIAEGGRNNTLTSILGKARQVLKMDREQLYAYGLDVNQKRCRPPLPESEVRTIANSISGYAVKETGSIVFPQSQPVQVQEPELENISVNPADASAKSLDFLPVGTLASTRLQDIYMDYFEPHDWPLTLALPSLVTAGSVIVPQNGAMLGDSMTNLYTALIANVGAGKSQIIQWACRALGIFEEPSGSHYVTGKWGSAEQLLVSLVKKQEKFTGKAVLVDPDEWSHLFAKAAIPEASFPSVLTTAFYRRNQVFTVGGTGGGREHNINLAMSFIGGIVEDEFDTVFGAASLGGLYDRFLFGRAPDKFQWSYQPCPLPDGKHWLGWNLKPVQINPSVYEVTKQWGTENPVLGMTRIPEVCVRIATIYGCLDGRPEITSKDVEPLKPLAVPAWSSQGVQAEPWSEPGCSLREQGLRLDSEPRFRLDIYCPAEAAHMASRAEAWASGRGEITDRAGP